MILNKIPTKIDKPRFRSMPKLMGFLSMLLTIMLVQETAGSAATYDI